MVIPLSIKRTVDAQVVILTLLIMLMAFWNLLLIARFERSIDEKEGQTSMSQWLSASAIKWINAILFVLFVGVALFYGYNFPVSPKLIIIFAAFTIYMAVPLVFSRMFRKKERYHRYVDMVFLISFLSLLPFG